MNANFAFVAGISDMHAVAPISAISEAVTASDGWHVARSVALLTTDDRRDSVDGLIGRVDLEGGVDASTQLTRVDAGVALKGTMSLALQSANNNGILTVGSSAWMRAQVRVHKRQR